MCYFCIVETDEGTALNTRDFIEERAANGSYHFTTEELSRDTHVSYLAANAALRRLRAKGRVAMPFRGFNVIVPPEYRRLGCLPADQFVPQLMAHLGLSYYAGLLSAAEYHGAAHQRPQVFQVVVEKGRPQVSCGRIRIWFVARRNVKQVPREKRNTPRGFIELSTPEATAFDLVGYPSRSGGLSNVATVLGELAEKLQPKRLAQVARLSPVPWSQRMGHLLEIVQAGKVTGPLAEYVARNAREYVPLNPQHEMDRCERSARWRLIVNEEVEPDL